MISRRALSFALCLAPFSGPASAQAFARDALVETVQELERDVGCRFGVAVLAPFGLVSTRGDERFPLCSTFKMLAAAAILKRVDEAQDSLDRRIVFDADDVVVGSPVTSQRIGGQGMTMAEICEAAITRSDNTAGNLMLTVVGGPAGLTRFARTIGDPVTRLDRIEPDLNESIAGDPRDTTTPLATLSNLRKLVAADALTRSSREQLVAWLVANRTGDARLRAGFPGDWRIGDKTGTGENGSANDIAVVWPPGQDPVFVAAYLTQTAASLDRRNAAFASVARKIASLL